MATDMGRGIIAPEEADSISADGVGEMRTIAATTVTAIEQAESSAISEASWQDDYLDTGADLNLVRTPGAHRVVAGQPVLNGPPTWGDESYVLEVLRMGRNWLMQRATNEAGQQYVRVATGGYGDVTFSGEWISQTWKQPPLPEDTDLDWLHTPGAHAIVGGWPVLNGPSWLPDESAAIEVIPAGLTWLIQRITVGNGRGAERIMRGISHGTTPNWDEWILSGSAGGSSGASTGGEARTAMEVTGQWTTHPEEDDYLNALSVHRSVERIDIGTTAGGRPIYGVRLGDPEDPAVAFICNQHGNEPGTREGAMIFAREMAQAQTMAILDLCVIIIPTLNVDGLHIRRQNDNGIDLNRDWADLTQPETQAIDALLSDYNVIAAIDAHSGGSARTVTMREAEARASTETLAMARLLYDTALDMYAEEGHDAGRYDEGTDLIDDPQLLRDQLASRYGAASMTLEVPSHWKYEPTPTRRYDPPPHWQAHVTKLLFHHVVETARRNIDDFVAAANLFTDPSFEQIDDSGNPLSNEWTVASGPGGFRPETGHGPDRVLYAHADWRSGFVRYDHIPGGAGRSVTPGQQYRITIQASATSTPDNDQLTRVWAIYRDASGSTVNDQDILGIDRASGTTWERQWTVPDNNQITDMVFAFTIEPEYTSNMWFGKPYVQLT